MTRGAPPTRGPAARPRRALAALERVRTTLDPALAGRKRAWLRQAWAGRTWGAAELVRFHDLLCFLQAYVEDAALHALARRLLAGFAGRYAGELRRHHAALVNSGIAGTAIRFPFFSPTGRWLAARAPEAMTIDWPEFANADRLEPLLPLLAHPAEAPGLDEYAFTPRQWLARMTGPRETDAAFLARAFAHLPMDDAARETLWDGLDVPMILGPGPATPTRTLAGPAPRRMHFTRTLGHTRPDLGAEIERRPRAIRVLSERAGRATIDLARAAMVTRERDLDAFAYGDPRDVRRVEYEDGLAFACIGVVPERRLLLEAVYGYLTLKNDVPIGYVLTSTLFGSAELAYNVFDTWRGVEAATVYARVLAMTRTLFGADSFTIVPYQLGNGNDEAITSGAWWFYRKLGFAPRDRATRRLAAREEEALRRNPAHRSSAATLRRLARTNLYFQPRGERDDVLGLLTLANVGLAATTWLAHRFGSARRTAIDVCAREAVARLGGGGGPIRGSADERRALERWAPVVLALPGIERWSAAEKRAALHLIRLKGARRESRFVRAFDAHARLRQALVQLARAADPDRR